MKAHLKKILLDDGEPDGFQWRKIYSEMTPSIKPIILTMYETGMRPKEVFHMRWNWLEQKSDGCWLIRIPAEGSIEDINFVEKTRFAHDVPVSSKLLKMFEEIGFQWNNELIFPASRKDGPRSDIESAFTNALQNAGLNGRGISPYALRRTRITIWDEIDSAASRYSTGHVPNDIHGKHYALIKPGRLFKLVGLDYDSRLGVRLPEF